MLFIHCMNKCILVCRRRSKKRRREEGGRRLRVPTRRRRRRREAPTPTLGREGSPGIHQSTKLRYMDKNEGNWVNFVF